MNQTIFSKLLLTVGVLVALTFTAYAAVPAPPVNQNIGIDDGVFNNLDEAQCRLCHGPNAEPDSPVDPAPTNVDRHHLRVDTLIGTDPTQDPSAAPCLDDPATCAVGDAFDCFSCHDLEFNPDTGAFEFMTFRDCLFCHEQVAGEASVHHLTPEAEARNCQACHGGIVTSFDDGHRIPTYEPSLVTPWPSGKPNGGDPNPVLPSLLEGNCNYCHNTATGSSTPSIDPDSGVLVFQNDETHHSTGFILDVNKCVWCHDVTPGQNAAASIRRCQDCHGIDTLHNIQYDNVGDGIDPGTEDQWYGHIGTSKDCEGCHGFTASVAAAQAPSGPIIPSLDSLSKTSFTAGQTAEIAVAGDNFFNTATINGTDYYFECDVLVTDSSGFSRTLEPSNITLTSMTVTMPADIPAGSYKVQAVKAQKTSNPLPIAITPPVEVYSADCSGGNLTVSGSGFSRFAYGANSGTGVTSGAMVASISSWSDDQIQAQFSGGCPDTAEISTVNGSMTASVQSDDPTVAAPVPELDRFNRKSGSVNKRRYAIGNYFGDGSGDTRVMFGDVAARIGYVTENRIKFYVPSVPSGYYNVTIVVDGQVSESQRFRVR